MPCIVHNIVQKIGYPTRSPEIRNSSLLQEYYESVDISRTKFFDNALSMATFDTNREWSALGKPTNRDEWEMTADTVSVCTLTQAVKLMLLLVLTHPRPITIQRGMKLYFQRE